MENVLDKILAIIMVVIMLFVIPLLYTYENLDDISYNYVYNEVNLFVEEVSDLGYVSPGRYLLLRDRIAATGLTYEVAIEHRKRLFVPDPADPMGYMAVYEGYFNQQILDETLFHPTSPASYPMSSGDFLIVEVISKGQTKAEVIKGLIHGGGNEGSIRVRIGGKVTSSGL